jgi:SAM-dependent methyltransferase
MSDEAVRAQYEAYPYPVRDPADEAKRLITGSPSHIDELNHYVFGGRRDFAKPFRALVAGGGTGDATIMLAQQLANAGCPAEVVYVDTSEASRAVAEARAQVRGLDNVRFEHLSLLDLPASGLGPFDYIDCCGVLHHLEDPEQGLGALVRVLADDGGMGLMLYGELGRTGVYPMQEMMRTLAAEEPAPARLETTRLLLKQLPATNWLRRNPFLADHLKQGDAGLYDLFLHARDRAYRVPEIDCMTASAGMRIVAFIEPAFYDPASYLADPELLARLEHRPWIERCAFAELLAGNIRKHVFYVVKQRNRVRLPDPENPEVVPILRDLDGAAFAKGFKRGAAMTASIDGIPFRRPLPPLTGSILPHVNGRRSLQEIHAGIIGASPNVSWETFGADFTQLFSALNGLGKMYLRCPSGAMD